MIQAIFVFQFHVDCLTIYSCKTSPKRFCPTRRTENEEVVSRAIEIWDNVKRVMEELESLGWSKMPKNKSYETLLQHYKDPSVVIKFHFFEDLANMLDIFLKDFKIDNPMFAFLKDVLENLVRRLLQMFIS